MADAVFSVEGTIVGNRTGEVERQALAVPLSQNIGERKKWFFGVVQMQTREKTALRVIEIQLAEGFDMTRYKIGTSVKIPVRISSSKNGRRILYREIPPIELASTGRACVGNAQRESSTSA
jgi:hypothetical protein